jgi:hypothetical protein
MLADRADMQLAIKMRKELAAARRLPAERHAEIVSADREHHDIALPGKVQPQRLRQLLGGGEVDVTVLDVDRHAGEDACLGKDPISIVRGDLVDELGIAQRRDHGRSSGPATGRAQGLYRPASRGYYIGLLSTMG